MAVILDDVLRGEARWIIAHGDNTDLLQFIPDESIDAVVQDPPAGIGFMGKMWDKAGVLGISGGMAMPATTASRNPTCRACGQRMRGKTRVCRCEVPDPDETDKRLVDRDAFVAVLTKTFRECLRVLKPGAHAFVWALPRTSSWTCRALEDAGFEIRDVKPHFFGQGFPKSLDVSKAIDKAAGAERDVVGAKRITGRHGEAFGYGPAEHQTRFKAGDIDVTAPATDEAKQWSGWGTALKPAQEHWILARKPLIRTVAANVLRYGTGAINIDGTRVFTDWSERPDSWKRSGHSAKPDAAKIAAPPGEGINCHPSGRWPPNAMFSHCPECEERGARTVKSGVAVNRNVAGTKTPGIYELGFLRDDKDRTYADADGTESVPAFDCVAGCPACGSARLAPSGGEPPVCECGDLMVWACPVAELDRQSGDCPSGISVTRNGGGGKVFDQSKGYADTPRPDGGYTDSGGASRFFPVFQPFIYAAKASTSEKNDGLEEKNSHPTVKGQDLMRRLCRMITPPGGIVLDCFAGTSSTGVAALTEGFRYIGIEREAKHVAEGRARCALAERDLAEERTGQLKMFAPPVPSMTESAPEQPVERQTTLFDLGDKPCRS